MRLTTLIPTDPNRLALASVILCFLFPPFIGRLADQGADEEVIDRLRFVSSLNSLRVRTSLAFSRLTVARQTSESHTRSPFSSSQSTR